MADREDGRRRSTESLSDPGFGGASSAAAPAVGAVQGGNEVNVDRKPLGAGFRILSCYPINPTKPAEGDNRIWILTEADRSVTTILLPGTLTPHL
jgi:hypothetical protein